MSHLSKRSIGKAVQKRHDMPAPRPSKTQAFMFVCLCLYVASICADAAKERMLSSNNAVTTCCREKCGMKYQTAEKDFCETGCADAETKSQATWNVKVANWGAFFIFTSQMIQFSNLHCISCYFEPPRMIKNQNGSHQLIIDIMEDK